MRISLLWMRTIIRRSYRKGLGLRNGSLKLLPRSINIKIKQINIMNKVIKLIRNIIKPIKNIDFTLILYF